MLNNKKWYDNLPVKRPGFMDSFPSDTNTASYVHGVMLDGACYLELAAWVKQMEAFAELLVCMGSSNARQ